MCKDLRMRRLFIVRKDLNMSPGKLAAQIGHCAEYYWLGIMTEYMSFQERTNDYILTDLTIPRDIVERYMEGSVTKTILRAKNLNHLLKAKTYAEELGLEEGKDYGFVNDSCLTELTPDEGMETCTTCFWTRPLASETAWEISKNYHLY